MNGYTQIGVYTPTAKRSPSAWESLLAAIPHLWLAVSIAISLLGWDYIRSISPTAMQTFANMMMAGILAVSLGILIYTRRHDHPLWAAAWSGYALFMGTTTLASLLLLLAPQNDTFQLGMLALSYFAIAFGYFLRLRRARLEALLMSLVLLVMGPLVFLDNISHLTEAIFVLLLGVMAATIAVVTVLGRNWRLSLLLVVVANLLAVFMQAYILTFMLVPTEMFPDGASEALPLLWTGTLLVLLFYGGTWAFWESRQRLQRKSA